MPELKKSWFAYPLRVRYQETDQMKVVYHANYLNWFEIGRTELIRNAGLPYRSLEEKGLLLPVVEAGIKFKQPALYDDLVVVFTTITNYSYLRLGFASQVRRCPDWNNKETIRVEDPNSYGKLLVEGSTRHVWVNRDWKPARVDRIAPELWNLLRAEFPDMEG